MRRKLYRITIKVHPTVYRYFCNNFPSVGGAFDVTRSLYYPLVSSMLYQNSVRIPSKLTSVYEKYREISIFVTEYDFYHYGFLVPPLQQVRFSRLLRRMIIDEICRRIAVVRAAFDMPLTRAVETAIDSNLFEDDELKPETLRKIYQRKYRSLEEEVAEFYRDSVTDFGTNERTFQKIIMGNLSQPIKTDTELWKI